MRNVIWLLIMIPCSALFTGIGIYAWNLKKPMWFWSGTEVDEKAITDVPKYNRANGWMWLAFSALFWIAALAGLRNMAAGGIVLCAGMAVGIPLLFFAYRRILKKYQAGGHP